jgi:hypothetical protein
MLNDICADRLIDDLPRRTIEFDLPMIPRCPFIAFCSGSLV